MMVEFIRYLCLLINIQYGQNKLATYGLKFHRLKILNYHLVNSLNWSYEIYFYNLNWIFEFIFIWIILNKGFI